MLIYVVFVIFGCFCTTHAGLPTATDWKYPGTKWCGRGSTATNDDDLGSIDKLDACCRDHDKCPIRLKADESDYGLTNDLSYTRSDCSCEDDFYNCLKAVSDDQKSHAEIVRLTYFQLLQPSCIKVSRRKRKCKFRIVKCWKWKTYPKEYKWENGTNWIDLDIWKETQDLF